MQQLIHLNNLKNSIKYQFDFPIKINSSIPLIDQNSIKEKIHCFIQQNNLLKKGKLELFFEPQPIRNKIIKCTAYFCVNDDKIISFGEGIDEYSALKDLLENLELELKYYKQNKTKQKDFIDELITLTRQKQSA